jgi:hypothetical protein
MYSMAHHHKFLIYTEPCTVHINSVRMVTAQHIGADNTPKTNQEPDHKRSDHKGPDQDRPDPDTTTAGEKVQDTLGPVPI